MTEAIIGCLCIVCVYLGFWMGRHTVEKPVEHSVELSKSPAVLDDESDPFNDAMRDRGELL